MCSRNAEVNLKPGPGPRPLISSTTGATEKEAKLAASREKHLKLAAKFAIGGEEALALKKDALRMVRLWQDKQLCSPVYIERWQKILNDNPMQIAKNLVAMDADEWGETMRQNTPFAMS